MIKTMVLAAAALAAYVASAETWYWSPTVQTPNSKGQMFYYRNNENN